MRNPTLRHAWADPGSLPLLVIGALLALSSLRLVTAGLGSLTPTRDTQIALGSRGRGDVPGGLPALRAGETAVRPGDA